MKLRNDYVTNSSSSSFILAKAGELNEKQKEKILKYVEENFFGKIILTPSSTKEELEEMFDEYYQFESEEMQETARKLLKDGKSINAGYVYYEDCDYYYAKIFENIWKIMEENGDGNFVALDDDLSY